MENALITEETKAFANEIDVAYQRVKSLMIKDEQDLSCAALLLKEVKGRGNKLELMRKSLTQPLDQTKAEIMAFFRPYTDLLTRSEAAIKGAIKFYHDEEEKRLVEARRIEEEAAKKREAELKAQHVEEAEKALEMGDVEGAEYHITRAETAVVKPIELGTVKAAGVTMKEVYKFEVTDFAALPNEYKIANDQLLGELARKSKAGASVPGVRFYTDKVVVGR